MLAASPSSKFLLCSLRASQTSDYSTKYHVSRSGATLSTHFDDPKNDLACSRSRLEATNGVLETDWVTEATDWAAALSLDTGINDANSSNSRLLTQLMPSTSSLDPALPPIAEALAVMSGYTLLLGAIDAPYVHFWNYSTPNWLLAVPVDQTFNASVQTQDYRSGCQQRWQGIFYVVLALVFLINIFCLTYLLQAIRGSSDPWM